MQLLFKGGGEPNTEFLWLLLVLVAFLALTVVVGWWAGSGKQDQAGAGEEAKPVQMEEIEPGVKSAKGRRGGRSGSGKL